MSLSNQAKHPTPPLSTKTIIWLLTTALIILMYLTGYYHSLYGIEKKRYLKLEDKYVRVRNMLGREVMQDLIDESYLQNE